jgi:hypothetical protein
LKIEPEGFPMLEQNFTVARADPHLGPNLRAVLIPGGGEEHGRWEDNLLARGRFVPLHYRRASLALPEWSDASLLAVRTSGGEYVGGLAIHPRRVSLVVPHDLLRVHRLGSTLPEETVPVALTALHALARAHPRVLRVNVELFSRDPAGRQRLGSALREHGFRRAEKANMYTDTLVFDLRPDEADLLPSLHKTGRQNLRLAERALLRVQPIEDPECAPRLVELTRETLERSGGRYHHQDWEGRIRFSARHPTLSRIVGIVRDDVPAPRGLLAFAWGCHHGDHVQYCDAGSTRDTGLRNLPLGYPLIWDLILWAKRSGASWFDLGGVTRGRQGDPRDPLGGISDFKRYFSREHVEVGEEWVLDQHSWRARVVGTAHRRLLAYRARKIEARPAP